MNLRVWNIAYPMKYPVNHPVKSKISDKNINLFLSQYPWWTHLLRTKHLPVFPHPLALQLVSLIKVGDWRRSVPVPLGGRHAGRTCFVKRIGLASWKNVNYKFNIQCIETNLWESFFIFYFLKTNFSHRFSLLNYSRYS